MTSLIPPRIWKMVPITVIVFFLGSGCAGLYNNLILDNKDHGIPCQDLPSLAEVQQVITVHDDKIQEIMAVNPGFVFVDIDTDTCPEHADIVISFDGHDDRIAIERIIGGNTLYGIPVRLRNR